MGVEGFGEAQCELWVLITKEAWEAAVGSVWQGEKPSSHTEPELHNQFIGSVHASLHLIAIQLEP